MGSRPPTTSPRSTGSPTSPCWRRAGSAAATPAATPPSSAPTTCRTRAPPSTSTPLKLWEGLSQELNYNVMFSQRGVMMLAHNEHDVQSLKRHVYANRLNGIDNEWLSAAGGQGLLPAAQYRAGHPLPRRRRGPAAARRAWRGTTRWPGAMRAAPMPWGVDIIQNCEVHGLPARRRRRRRRRRDHARGYRDHARGRGGGGAHAAW